MRRQQALRTAFDYENETLHSVVRRDLRAPWEAVDLSGMEAVSRRHRLEECLRETALHCFDLRHGPLLLARLIRLGADEHVLALNVHHIVADGSSTNIMLREIAAGYQARLVGHAAGMPPLKWQYTDYVACGGPAPANRGWNSGCRPGILARPPGGGPRKSTTFPPDLARPSVQGFDGSALCTFANPTPGPPHGVACAEPALGQFPQPPHPGGLRGPGP